MGRLAAAWCVVCGLWGVAAPAVADDERISIILFSKTAGYRHESIHEGIMMMHRISRSCHMTVTESEDASLFTAETLAGTDVVIFMNTTGDILNDDQQAAMQAFIEGGGGFIGIHSASDTEYDWPFYGELIGRAWIKSHPDIQEARLEVVDAGHPAAARLPVSFMMTDEWHNYRNRPVPDSRIILRLDEDSYAPGDGAMGDHPIAWSREIGQGRAFFTGLGHRIEIYTDRLFIRHILGAIAWAADWDMTRSHCPQPKP